MTNQEEGKPIMFKPIGKRNQEFSTTAKAVMSKLIIKETTTIMTVIDEIDIMLSQTSESVKSEDSRVCDSPHLRVSKFKVSQKPIFKSFSHITTSISSKQSFKEALLKFSKQTKIVTLSDDHNQIMITTLQVQLKRKKKAHEQLASQIKILKAKNTDIEEECKTIKSMLNNTKIDHKIAIQKRTMQNTIIHNLIKLNHSMITALTNTIKHVTENETFTVFFMKFENMLTEMTIMYKKHSQFLLPDQCSKYCLSFNLSDESFMNLITDLIKKHHMSSFNISFFEPPDTEVIFTAYKGNTAITKADIAEIGMAEALKSDKAVFEL